MSRKRSTSLAAALLLCGALPSCITEEPVRKTAPARSRPSEERRSHALAVPGTVGVVEGTRYYVDLQSDRPESTIKRPVLVEVDERNREIGHAYLNGRPNKGFADTDVVVLASQDVLSCYDCYRHELRWELSYGDRGVEVDELVRRGEKLDVHLSSRAVETLSLATGQRTVP